MEPQEPQKPITPNQATPQPAAPLPPAPQADTPIPTGIPTHQPQPHGRRVGTILMVAGGLLAVVAALLAYLLFFMPKTPAADDTAAQKTAQGNTSTLKALERGRVNTSRKNDVGAIISVALLYASNNTAQYPTQVQGTGYNVVLCGSSCDDTDRESATLSYYKAENMSFKQFDAALKVPDADTVYLVNGAACQTDEKGISPEAAAPRSFAVLFALDAGDSKIEQRCEAN